MNVMDRTGIGSAMTRKKQPAEPSDAMLVGGIGRRIRRIRGDLNQDQFSKLIGLEKRTLVRYESEKTYPTAATIAKICYEFTVSPAWLIFGSERADFGSIPPESRTLRRSA